MDYQRIYQYSKNKDFWYRWSNLNPHEQYSELKMHIETKHLKTQSNLEIDELAKSLEGKLEAMQEANTQYQNEYTDEIFVDNEEMIGDNEQQIQEQGITSLKVEPLNYPLQTAI